MYPGVSRLLPAHLSLPWPYDLLEVVIGFPPGKANIQYGKAAFGISLGSANIGYGLGQFLRRPAEKALPLRSGWPEAEGHPDCGWHQGSEAAPAEWRGIQPLPHSTGRHGGDPRQCRSRLMSTGCPQLSLWGGLSKNLSLIRLKSRLKRPFRRLIFP